MFERASALGEIGAGLVVWPNGIWSLRKLGLAGPIEAASRGLRTLDIRTADGHTLKHMDAAALWPGLDAEWVAMRRSDLHHFLRPGLEGCEVHLDHRLVGFVQDGAGVLARFSNGSDERGDVLIGADGLRSATRAQIFGELSVRYAGYTDWRCVTAVDPGLTLADMTLTHGRGAGTGLFAMSGNRAFWFVSRNAPAGGQDPPGGKKSSLLTWLRGWHEPIAQVVASSPEDEIIRTDIFDRDPILAWGRGRVTLAGDAAHPMTPDWGQGASQALEDAVALGDAFSAEHSPHVALRSYESSRIKRANYIVSASRQAGAMNRPDGSLGMLRRNLFYRFAPFWLQRYGIGMIVGKSSAQREPVAV